MLPPPLWLVGGALALLLLVWLLRLAVFRLHLEAKGIRLLIEGHRGRRKS